VPDGVLRRSLETIVGLGGDEGGQGGKTYKNFMVAVEEAEILAGDVP
jgi:hypothetical protein